MFENVRILSSHFISNQIKIFCFLENSEDIAPLCSDIPHWILLFFLSLMNIHNDVSLMKWGEGDRTVCGYFFTHSS